MNSYEGRALPRGESSLRASSSDRRIGERMCRDVARAIADGDIGYQDCDPATEAQRVRERAKEMKREFNTKWLGYGKNKEFVPCAQDAECVQ